MMHRDDRLDAPAIDLGARDYRGFRQLLLDLIDRSGTRWTERSAADLGVTLVELLAFHLDRLAYAGDRVAGEAFLATAVLHESIRRHAALGDHRLDRGSTTIGQQHFHLAPGTSLALPAGALLGSELEPGEEPEARLFFETTAPARLDARRNELRLARSVVAGARVLRLLAVDRGAVDLRALGVRRGAVLTLAGRDGRGESVRVAGVSRGAVVLESPLRASYVAGNEDRGVRVFGNMVPIRRGRSTGWIWVARAGIARADVEANRLAPGPYLRLRTARVRALLDEVERLRALWSGDAYLERLRTHALRRAELAVCRLRERPPFAVDAAFARREGELADAELALRDLLRALGHSLPDVLAASPYVGLPSQRVPLPGDEPRAWDELARAWVPHRPLWLDDPMLFLDGRPTLEVAVHAADRVEAWTEVEDLLRSGPDDRHYVLELDRDGRGTVCFGDGRHGAVPPPGSRILARWICGAVAGNIGHRALTRLLDPRTSAAYPATDPATTGPVLLNLRDPRAGRTLDIGGDTFNPLGSEGARPTEDLAEIPRALRSKLQRLELPVTALDFVEHLERRRDVAEAAVLGETGQRVDLAVLVERGHDVGHVLKDIQTWLSGHRLAGTRVRVRPARELFVSLAVVLDIDPSVRREDTARRVRDALQAALQGRERRLGRGLARSELYRVIEAVPGVVASEVIRFDWASAHSPGVRESLTPPADAVLRCVETDERAATGTITTWIARPFALSADVRFTDPDELPPLPRLEQIVADFLSGPASPLVARRHLELSPAELATMLNEGPFKGARFRLRGRRLGADGRPLTALRLGDDEVPQLRDLHLAPVQVDSL